MELDFIDINELRLSPLNVRKHGPKDGGDLLPSIRSLGLIQPLLVRPNGKGYEIVAGQRRFNACKTLHEEGTLKGGLPCAILDKGEDAKAIEASLVENIARLPMDEIDQYKAFATLEKEGKSVEEITDHFGVTERLVRQRLSIANLYEPILNAYRREEIQPSTVRLLTMATARQQKAWWKLLKGEDDYAPLGNQLKSWLFGGDQIPVSNALFDLESYRGVIITDLFSEERYFAESADFWQKQGVVISQMVQDYRDDGWPDVILHDVGERWHRWDYGEVGKDQGGEVHITCAANGEVKVHKGLLHDREIAKRKKAESSGEGVGKPSRPELSKAAQNYFGLHRHAAVRGELLKSPQTALYLIAAHMIAGSGLWHVKAETQNAEKPEISESLKSNLAQQRFEMEREEIRVLLGMSDDMEIIAHPRPFHEGHDFVDILARLLKLEDQDITRILTFLMAESLQAHTPIVEALGQCLNVSMEGLWTPDEVFFDLLRDKEAINAMVGELAGKDAAKGNVTATAKVQKTVLQACLKGERTAKVENWQSRYMAFPMRTYTKRGGIEAVDAWKSILKLFKAA